MATTILDLLMTFDGFIAGENAGGNGESMGRQE